LGKWLNTRVFDYFIDLLKRGSIKVHMKAIILFGHGARDARWREPFDRLASLWQSQHPTVLVELAFLEIMQPSLEGAITSLSQSGATEIVVVPVFFGQGGHLRNDFPALLECSRKQFPLMKISTTPAVGESEAVLQAIVDFGARSL
jgi:sirohydrochlorin cobaltochelatase